MTRNFNRYQKTRNGKSQRSAYLRPKRIQTTAAIAPPHIQPRVSLKERAEAALQAIDGRLARVRRSLLALAAIPAFMAGAIFGLVVLGWWAMPVQWIDADLSQVSPAQQAMVIELAADLYAFDHNPERAAKVMAWPGSGTAVCRVLAEEADQAAQLRLAYLAMVVQGEPCE